MTSENTTPENEEQNPLEPLPDLDAIVDPETDRLFTPDSFSPLWCAEEPTTLLSFEFEIPYTRDEWDFVFTTLIELLAQKDAWTWKTAIAQLLEALKTEAQQSSNLEEYQPYPLEERVQQVFEAVAAWRRDRSQTATRPPIIGCSSHHGFA